MKPEARAAYKEMPPDYKPFALGPAPRRQRRVCPHQRRIHGTTRFLHPRRQRNGHRRGPGWPAISEIGVSCRAPLTG